MPRVQPRSRSRSRSPSRTLPILLAATLSPAIATAAPSAPSAPPATAHSPRVQTFTFSTTSRGRLGVQVNSMTPELRRFFGAPEGRGILVAKVHAGSVAEKADLRVGDVVVEVDGDSVDQVADVRRALADRKKGDRADVVVIRKKKRVRKTVKLDDDGSLLDPSSSLFRPSDSSLHLGFGGDMAEQLRAMKQQLDRMQKRLDRLEGKSKRSRKRTKRKKSTP